MLELPYVSVLISTMDRRELLHQALESLHRLDYPREKMELVVVEETSSPEDPGADRYVALPRERRGFAWSRNAALRAASHPLVAFTDDDVVVDRSWLRELVAPFEDPEVAAVAGAVLAQPSGVLGKTEIVLGFPGGGLRRVARAGDAPTPTHSLSTVNAAARREVLNQLGAFSESTGIYGGEDSELFGRLTERYAAVFNPRALVYHRARDSVRGIARWFYRRGISAVALLHLARHKRVQLVLRELWISFSVRLAIVATLLVAIRAPVLVSLFVLGSIYYVLALVRYRFALQRMGLSVLLLTPITKLWMDAAFDVGRFRGLSLWISGSFDDKSPMTSTPSTKLDGPRKKTRTRVLLAANTGTFVGGGQVSLLGLVDRMDRDRFQPFVVCPEEGDFLEALLERGIPTLVRRMPSFRGPSVLSVPFALRSWLELVRRYNIDLLHANGTRAMLHAGPVGRLASVPVLWHVRVLGTDGLLDRALARISTRVLVNSQAVAGRFDFLADHSSSRGPDIIHNGVDLEPFARAQPDPALRRAWDIEGKFVLLVLAQLIPWKRQELAIEILSLLRTRGLDAALVLVGDEVPSTKGERARLEEIAKRQGVEKHCVFAGFRRDVPQVLKLADLVLHTARDEPFGRALIEAMASSLAVVTAGGGGVEEVVQDGKTGVVIQSASPRVWAEAIEDLYRDPSRRRGMGAAGRRRAEEHFSVEAHVASVERVYEEVLSSPQ